MLDTVLTGIPHASLAIMFSLAHDAFVTGGMQVELAVIGHFAVPIGTHLPTHFGLVLVHIQTGLFSSVQSQSVVGSGLLEAHVHSFLSSFVHLQVVLIILHSFSPDAHVS